MNTGQLCVKIAGRDAGKKAVIVEIMDKNLVLIDGETRRRKCNIMHLLPLKQTLEIKSGASHDEVKNAFEKIGIKIVDTKPKAKAARNKKVVAKPAATVKKVVKKVVKAKKE